MVSVAGIKGWAMETKTTPKSKIGKRKKKENLLGKSMILTPPFPIKNRDGASL